MSQHSAEHEALLSAVLAGERRRGEPEVQRLLEACAGCRDGLERLRATAATLEQAGAEQRALLVELPRLAGAPGEAEVAATIARLAAGARPVRGSRRVLLVLAAAAVVGLALWAARHVFTSARPAAPVWLQGNGLVLRGPKDGVERFERFAWSYSGTAARFRLRIHAAETGLNGPAIVTKELEASEWIPDEAERKRLPARILWQVEALDEFGAVRPSGSASGSSWLEER